MSKVSARGTAITCFAKFVDEYANNTATYEQFRATTTADIMQTLSVDAKLGSRLFAKAQRNARNKVLYPEVSFPTPKHPGRPARVAAEVVALTEQEQVQVQKELQEELAAEQSNESEVVKQVAEQSSDAPESTDTSSDSNGWPFTE